MATLKWGSGTHPGQIRAKNEDNLFVDDGVFVVADGMGGHEAGEVASLIAVERIREALEGDGRLTADQVVESISAANGDIFRAAIANPGQSGMGTTVTAIAVVEDPMAGRGAPNIDDNDPIDTDPDGNPRTTPVIPREFPEALVLANVGDSRTYLFRHDRLRRITTDHSYVQELVATGEITDDEARVHPRRNIITRALGIEPDVQVDWWTLPLVRNDRFLLCSDGLVDEVTDAEITETLLEFSDPQRAADHLIEMANAAGGRDNITVVVVDVVEGDDPPDPTQEIDIVPTWADDTVPVATTAASAASLADLADPDASTAADAPSGDAGTGSKRSFRPRRRDRRAAKEALAADAAALAASASATTGDADVDAPDAAGSVDSRGTGTGADADGTGGDDDAPARKRPRLGRAVAAFVVLAALVAGAVALGAWARRGYFVDFDDRGVVTVYQGRSGGVLWIDPTIEARGPSRDDLADDSVEAVDARPDFSSRRDAEAFVASLDPAPDGTDADTTDGDGAGADRSDDGSTTTDTGVAPTETTATERRTTTTPATTDAQG